MASRESLPQDILQRRLLLCLSGLGTNTGFKRLANADPGTTDSDLRYLRSRSIQKESLRNAIAHVASAIFAIRRAPRWGEGTTACASDSKKFGCCRSKPAHGVACALPGARGDDLTFLWKGNRSASIPNSKAVRPQR